MTGRGSLNCGSSPYLEATVITDLHIGVDTKNTTVVDNASKTTETADIQIGVFAYPHNLVTQCFYKLLPGTLPIHQNILTTCRELHFTETVSNVLVKDFVAVLDAVEQTSAWDKQQVLHDSEQYELIDIRQS